MPPDPREVSSSPFPPCSAGAPGSIPGSGRSPGGRHGYPLQRSCLQNPMASRWQATAHGVTKSRTRLSYCFSLKYSSDLGAQGAPGSLSPLACRLLVYSLSTLLPFPSSNGGSGSFQRLLPAPFLTYALLPTALSSQGP